MCLIGPQRSVRTVAKPLLAVRCFCGTEKEPVPVYKRYSFDPVGWNATDIPKWFNQEDSRCGFWAFKLTAGWRKHIENLVHEATLIGIVELKGRVVVHRDGYRAQHLRIKRLWHRPPPRKGALSQTLTAIDRSIARRRSRT